MENFLMELNVTEYNVKQFMDTIDSLETQVPGQQLISSNNNVDVLEEMTLLVQRFDTLIGVLVSLGATLACSPLYYLYNNVVQVAICTDALEGAEWVFSCLCLLIVFGFLMLTFRSVLYPLEESDNMAEDSEHDDESNSATVPRSKGGGAGSLVMGVNSQEGFDNVANEQVQQRQSDNMVDESERPELFDSTEFFDCTDEFFDC
jgi:hypothetical protein